MKTLAMRESQNIERIVRSIEISGYTEELTATTSTYRLFTRKDRYLVLHEFTRYFAIFKRTCRVFNPDTDEVIVDWTDELESME